MNTEILLGKEIARIDKNHFAGCTELQRVTILNPRMMLPDGLFRDCPQVTIHAHSGSFAEFYAKKNGLKFERL